MPRDDMPSLAELQRNMTDLQRVMTRGITPDLIRYGQGIDWRFVGDFNRHIYNPELVCQPANDWERAVAAILQRHFWGLWIVHGPRGSGKSGFAASTAFYLKELYGRKIGSNFPLKDAFGEYRTVSVNDIRDQRERLAWLANKGSPDWENQDLEAEGIWLPGMVILDDEFYQEVDKRRCMSQDNKELTDFNLQIRHFDVTFIGLAPDKELLDTQRINNASLVSTEVRCVYDIDEGGEHWIRGYLTQNESTTSGWQRVSGPQDRISYNVAKHCNLWWTKGAIRKKAGDIKGKMKRHAVEPVEAPSMVDVSGFDD